MRETNRFFFRCKIFIKGSTQHLFIAQAGKGITSLIVRKESPLITCILTAKVGYSNTPLIFITEANKDSTRLIFTGLVRTAHL